MARRTQAKKDPRTQSVPSRVLAKEKSFLEIVAPIRNTILQALTILAVGVWAFWPAQHGSWLMDDGEYITNNPLLSQPDRLWKAWFEPGSFVEYYPIEESLQWAQWQLWHDQSFGYHLTNLALHLVSAFLVWQLLAKFGLRLAWLGGLIFAIHPTMVESVAYVSEFKNTLSLPPFLLAMFAWIDYEETKRPRDYALSFGFFLVAMLCKITMALFPLVILLYAWWKRGRVSWSDLKASLPFALISATLIEMTTLAGTWFNQSNHAASEIPIHDLASRVALIGQTFTFYFAKCFWPVPPLPYYPHWNVDGSSLIAFLPLAVWIGVLCWLWTKRTSWGRHALLGLGFFFINLVPFLGFKDISYMEATWVFDHLLYIPIIGLIGLVIAALVQLEYQVPAAMRYIGTGVGALVLIVLACETESYAATFADPKALWEYTLQANPGAWAARNSLGLILLGEGNYADAADQFEQILAQLPDLAPVHNNLGNALKHIDRVPEAEDQYRQAIAIKPDYFEAHYNLANTLLKAGQTSEAIAEFESAAKINPQNFQIHLLLANILLLSNRAADAIGEYQQVIALNPNLAEAHNNLGIALQRTGKTQDAEVEFQRAVEINPNYEKARNNLAKLRNQASPGTPGN